VSSACDCQSSALGIVPKRYFALYGHLEYPEGSVTEVIILFFTYKQEMGTLNLEKVSVFCLNLLIKRTCNNILIYPFNN